MMPFEDPNQAFPGYYGTAMGLRDLEEERRADEEVNGAYYEEERRNNPLYSNDESYAATSDEDSDENEDMNDSDEEESDDDEMDDQLDRPIENEQSFDSSNGADDEEEKREGDLFHSFHTVPISSDPMSDNEANMEENKEDAHVPKADLPLSDEETQTPPNVPAKRRINTASISNKATADEPSAARINTRANSRRQQTKRPGQDAIGALTSPPPAKRRLRSQEHAVAEEPASPPPIADAVDAIEQRPLRRSGRMTKPRLSLTDRGDAGETEPKRPVAVVAAMTKPKTTTGGKTPAPSDDAVAPAKVAGLFCILCAKQIGEHTKPDDHALLHLEEKPYRCHMCPYTLASVNTLKNHYTKSHSSFCRSPRFLPQMLNKAKAYLATMKSVLRDRCFNERASSPEDPSFQTTERSPSPQEATIERDLPLPVTRSHNNGRQRRPPTPKKPLGARRRKPSEAPPKAQQQLHSVVLTKPDVTDPLTPSRTLHARSVESRSDKEQALETALNDVVTATVDRQPTIFLASERTSNGKQQLLTDGVAEKTSGDSDSVEKEPSDEMEEGSSQNKVLAAETDDNTSAAIPEDDPNMPVETPSASTKEQAETDTIAAAEEEQKSTENSLETVVETPVEKPSTPPINEENKMPANNDPPQAQNESEPQEDKESISNQLPHHDDQTAQNDQQQTCETEKTSTAQLDVDTKQESAETDKMVVEENLPNDEPTAEKVANDDVVPPVPTEQPKAVENGLVGCEMALSESETTSAPLPEKVTEEQHRNSGLNLTESQDEFDDTPTFELPKMTKKSRKMCNLCQIEVTMVNHAAARHLDEAQFWCRICNTGYKTMNTIDAHVARKHGDLDAISQLLAVVDKLPLLQSTLDMLVVRCFHIEFATPQDPAPHPQQQQQRRLSANPSKAAVGRPCPIMPPPTSVKIAPSRIRRTSAGASAAIGNQPPPVAFEQAARMFAAKQETFRSVKAKSSRSQAQPVIYRERNPPVLKPLVIQPSQKFDPLLAFSDKSAAPIERPGTSLALYPGVLPKTAQQRHSTQHLGIAVKNFELPSDIFLAPPSNSTPVTPLTGTKGLQVTPLTGTKGPQVTPLTGTKGRPAAKAKKCHQCSRIVPTAQLQTHVATEHLAEHQNSKTELVEMFRQCFPPPTPRATPAARRQKTLEESGQSAYAFSPMEGKKN